MTIRVRLKPDTTTDMFFLALVGRSLAESRKLLAGFLLLLGGFQVVLVIVAASFESSGSFSLLTALAPGFVQQSLGSALPLVASFQGILMLGYFHPVIVMLLSQMAIYLATEPAHEVEHALMDLLLARPIARHWLVSRSVALMLAGSAAGAAAMAGGTWAGLVAFAPAGAAWPPFSRVASLACNLLATAWCVGAVGLVAGAAATRRGSAIALVGIGAVLVYLVEFVGQSWAPARPLARLSPFHYYSGADVLLGTASVTTNVTVLALAAAAFIALAYVLFARRDL